MDFTFKNELIRKYFNGDDSYIPTSELIYIHNHPLVRPNFVTEIDEEVAKLGALIVKHNLRGASVDILIDLGIQIGNGLPDVTTETAPQILQALRQLHRHCCSLIEMLEPKTP